MNQIVTQRRQVLEVQIDTYHPFVDFKVAYDSVYEAEHTKPCSFEILKNHAHGAGKR